MIIYIYIYIHTYIYIYIYIYLWPQPQPHSFSRLVFLIEVNYLVLYLIRHGCEVTGVEWPMEWSTGQIVAWLQWMSRSMRRQGNSRLGQPWYRPAVVGLLSLWSKCRSTRWHCFSTISGSVACTLLAREIWLRMQRVHEKLHGAGKHWVVAESVEPKRGFSKPTAYRFPASFSNLVNKLQTTVPNKNTYVYIRGNWGKW